MQSVTNDIRVPVNRNGVRGYAIIDKSNKHLLDYSWFDCKGYVARDKHGTPELMHRVIMNAKPGQSIDHIDGNKRNNKVSNLRVCNHAQNNRNKPPSVKNKTGFKGVSFDTQTNKFRADIRFDGNRMNLGRYNTAKEAALAYNAAAVKYFGDFAWLNKIGENNE